MKSYERPLTLWGLLWALPVTLVGILVALLSLSSWGLKDGMMVCKGNRGLAWLRWQIQQSSLLSASSSSSCQMLWKFPSSPPLHQAPTVAS